MVTGVVVCTEVVVDVGVVVGMKVVVGGVSTYCGSVVDVLGHALRDTIGSS